MNFSDYIEFGKAVCGSYRELAKRIGVSERHLPEMRNGLRSMPDAACVRLGELVDLEHPDQMITLRNLAMAKTDAEREFWDPFAAKVKQAVRSNVVQIFVASFALIFMLMTLSGVMNETSFVSIDMEPLRASTGYVFASVGNTYYRQLGWLLCIGAIVLVGIRKAAVVSRRTSSWPQPFCSGGC